MSTINLECNYCHKLFSKSIGFYNADIKRGQTKWFCCIQCANISKRTSISINCTNCNKQFTRRKCELKTINVFCSQSCSAIFNNKRIVKLKKKCVLCDSLIRSVSTYCKTCYNKLRKNHISDKYLRRMNYAANIDKERTIGDLELLNGKSSKYSYIRMHARTVMSNVPKICNRCQYSKYVECCHIKAIKEFSKDTPISIVNHPDNLLWLCPNCHVEMDKNL